VALLIGSLRYTWRNVPADRVRCVTAKSRPADSGALAVQPRDRKHARNPHSGNAYVPHARRWLQPKSGTPFVHRYCGAPARSRPASRAPDTGDAIESQIAERLLDVVMSQRRRRSMQQPQDTDPRRRGARAGPANQQRRGFSFCRRVDRRVQDSHHGCEFKHSPQAHATQLQLSGVTARSNPCDRKKGVRFPPLQTTIRRASVLRRKEYRLGELSRCFSAERG
jgi:hypothetical protein